MNFRENPHSPDEDVTLAFQALISPAEDKEVYSIATPLDDSAIGVAVLKHIDQEKKRALAVIFILHPEWGTPEIYADALDTLLSRAFIGLELDTILANTPENLGDIINGFTEIGAIRLAPSQAFTDGTDRVYASFVLSRDDWLKRKNGDN